LKKIAVLLVLAIVFGGVAYATIPDSGGVIHGCYKANGDLRVIDSPSQSCAMNETALAWSQEGPQGATGAQGLAGVSDFEVVSHSQNVTFDADVSWAISLQATCPSGKVVLGGGGLPPDSLGSWPKELSMYRSQPVGNPPSAWVTGWRDVSATSGSYSVNLTVFATCANAV